MNYESHLKPAQILNLMQKTQFHSYCSGRLAKGCLQCVQGKKLVLFITGLCAQKCFYCPVSEHKYGFDEVYANEWKVLDPDDPKELLEEAKLTNAIGAGITGGDPLVKIDRCVKYIKLMKKKFGKNFHFHLYTPLKLVSYEKLETLHDAGLDEIRFHPDLDDKILWNRLELGKKFDWDVGIEIPVVPGYENKIKDLIDYAHDKVDFINFNELEISDTKAAHYNLKLKQKDSISYGVKGSAELALKMVKYAEKKKLRAHFCTAKLKDGVQMSNRIKIRSSNIALPFDTKTDEGMLIRGCVYLPEFAPGFGYRDKLKNYDRNKINQKLERSKEKLSRFIKTLIVIDTIKPRLLIAPEKVRKNKDKIKKLGLVPAIVEEYPTADAIEIEVEIL